MMVSFLEVPFVHLLPTSRSMLSTPSDILTCYTTSKTFISIMKSFPCILALISPFIRSTSSFAIDKPSPVEALPLATSAL